jgi:hypothetical protein
MRLKKFGLALVPALSAASLLAISGAGSFAAAGNDHPARHAHTAAAAHPHYFGSYRPLYGYYTRHGQYVPGAGDRLIYGPGYVYVPGHEILDEACNLPSSTCPNEYRDVR